MKSTLFSTEEPFFRQDPPPIVTRDSFLEEVEG